MEEILSSEQKDFYEKLNYYESEYLEKSYNKDFLYSKISDIENLILTLIKNKEINETNNNSNKNNKKIIYQNIFSGNLFNGFSNENQKPNSDLEYRKISDLKDSHILIFKKLKKFAKQKGGLLSMSYRLILYDFFIFFYCENAKINLHIDYEIELSKKKFYYFNKLFT